MCRRGVIGFHCYCLTFFPSFFSFKRCDGRISAPAALISPFRSLVRIPPSLEIFYFFPATIRDAALCALRSSSVRPSVRPLPSLTMCSSQKSPLFSAAHHLKHPHETESEEVLGCGGAIYHFSRDEERKCGKGKAFGRRTRLALLSAIVCLSSCGVKNISSLSSIYS